MAKYPTKWVKCPAHSDPKLAGKARLRKPWAKNRFFTEEPQEVELTPQVAGALARLLMQGALVECEPGGQPMTATPKRPKEV